MVEVSRRSHASHGGHRAPGGGRGGRVGGWLAAVLVAVVLVLVGLGAGYLLGRRGASASPTVAAAPVAPASPAASTTSALPPHPTFVGAVTRVVSGDEVVVHAGGGDVPVRILGIDTPDPMPAAPGSSPACGSREALEFADAQLDGQTVTLVPDPTQPELDDQGRRLAYVVLRSQLNYTDAVLLGGIGRADTSRPLWYADVFLREQRQASDGARGIWGPPCRERP